MWTYYLKETIKRVKGLHKEGLIYLDGFTAGPKLSSFSSLIGDVNIAMDKDMHEAIKDDREELTYEMVLLTFKGEDLILSSRNI